MCNQRNRQIKMHRLFLNSSDINELQKKYLFEACKCDDKSNLLSATVMLGASAKFLLLDLCRHKRNISINRRIQQLLTLLNERLLRQNVHIIDL